MFIERIQKYNIMLPQNRKYIMFAWELAHDLNLQPVQASPPSPNLTTSQAIAPQLATRSSNTPSPPAAPNDRLIGLDLNEISIQPASNGFEWVELKNNYWLEVDISGYKLSNEEGI